MYSMYANPIRCNNWLGWRIMMGSVVSSYIYYKLLVPLPPNLCIVCGLTQSFINILYKSVANINNTLVKLCNAILQIEATFQARSCVGMMMWSWGSGKVDKSFLSVT
jgi:hypothetical protein